MVTFNKTLAGYHMLMILAHVDGEVNKEEEKVIRKYVKLNYSFLSNLDEETNLLNSLPEELFYNHFCKAAIDFYSQTSEKERNYFLDFVMKVILADRTVTNEENIYLNELYNLWDLA